MSRQRSAVRGTSELISEDLRNGFTHDSGENSLSVELSKAFSDMSSSDGAVQFEPCLNCLSRSAMVAWRRRYQRRKRS